MKRVISALVIAIMALSISCTGMAHPGRTDSKGGHKDNKNASGLGGYHYHCGGYPAHLHEGGVCRYRVLEAAARETMVQSGIEYTLLDGEAHVVGYLCGQDEYDVVIPDALGECPVASICGDAFLTGGVPISRVHIPGSVRYIDECSFSVQPSVIVCPAGSAAESYAKDRSIFCEHP